MNRRLATLGAALAVAVASFAPATRGEMIRPAKERYSPPDVTEVPDFQRHVLPLMGRLGCNTRACHGSFQGQGGFRLSLFGYDFKMDHEALLKKDAGRVDIDNAEASKILQKPTLVIPHKGGKRLEPDSWQYRMLVNWIDDGAKPASGSAHFERLEVSPSEIVFGRDGEQVPLRVVAHWSDGSVEDVTCISRYRTNDESIAEIDEDGVVTSKGKGDTHVVAFYDNGVAVTQVIRPVSEQVGPKYPDVPAPTKVDGLVLDKLRKLGVVPSEVCSDAEFLRRVSLDMTGTLPTPEEVSTFLADPSPSKREAKVDELLSRPSYAAWWTTKLCDITGNTPRNLQMQVNTDQPSRFWYEWIYRRVKENTPYDQLIAGIVLGTSRKPGQSYEDYIKEESTYFREDHPADFSERETMPYFWARRNLRQPEEKALGFSYTFLGVRLECAQCHKHPFDQWTQDDFNQFTAFFRSVRYGNAPEKAAREAIQKLNEELGLKPMLNGNQRRKILADRMKEGKPIPWQEVFVVPAGAGQGRGRPNAQAGKTGRVVTPKLLGGEEVSLASAKDPREPLMEWVRRKDNPYFARAWVNRVWANYFGLGIINPPDDMNLANPPSNAALLDYLAEGFAEHDFDMKWLHREIVLSATYQRSWHTNQTNRLDNKNFSHALVRRLPAEVLIDAVTQATSSSSDLVKLVSLETDRAIGSKGAGGYRRNGGDYAGRVFGRSTRDTNCDCSRSNEPNLLQSIYLQNDQELLAAIERPGGWLAETAGSVVKARNRGKGGPDDRELAAVLAKRIAQMEKRLEQLGEDGDKSAAETVETKINASRKELREVERRLAAPTPSFDAEAAIRSAYLRTLARNPGAQEVELALDYFKQSSDEEKGLRDLLWALLNTKEFITNH